MLQINGLLDGLLKLDQYYLVERVLVLRFGVSHCQTLAHKLQSLFQLSTPGLNIHTHTHVHIHTDTHSICCSLSLSRLNSLLAVPGATRLSHHAFRQR